MNPQEPAPPPPPPSFNPSQHVGNELTAMQPGERKICEIRRHPFGIISIYAMIVFILTVIAVLAFAIGPALAASSGNKSQATAFGAVAFIFFVILSAIYGVIAHIVYWANRWIVTTDSITQITQTSLFNRESSQLAMHNIEDITVEQFGIVAQFFKFGALKAETAGEHSKFSFNYCPNPNYYAKQILDAREAFVSALHGHDPEYAAAYLHSAYRGPTQQPPPGTPPQRPQAQPEPQNPYPPYQPPPTQPPAY